MFIDLFGYRRYILSFILGWMFAVGGLVGFRAVKRLMRTSVEVSIAKSILKSDIKVPVEVVDAAKKVMAATSYGERKLAKIILMNSIRLHRKKNPDPDWLERIRPRSKFLLPRDVLWEVDFDSNVPPGLKKSALKVREAMEEFNNHVIDPANAEYIQKIFNNMKSEEMRKGRFR